MIDEAGDPFLSSLRLAPTTPPKPKPVIPQSTLDLPPAPQPDALVLVEITQLCRCGAQFPHNGRNLMLRTGRNFSRADTGFTLNSHLPREVMRITERVLSCFKCFGFISGTVHSGPQEESRRSASLPRRSQ